MASTITDDDIYFGSERCYYRHVPGIVDQFISHSDYRFSSSISEIEVAGARNSFQKQKIEGQEIPVVVPGVPALDIIPADSGTNEIESKMECSPLPEIFKQPLMKCPPDHPDCLHDLYGVKSGTRSGLVKYDGEWYRLKGCGNNDEGFIIRLHKTPSSASTSDKETWQEIRGCAFYNTSLRELYYTSYLSTCADFQCNNIISANGSIGLCHYMQPSEALLGVEQTVRPVCILERTMGDRRFGTHVLAGIELILPLLIRMEDLDVHKLQAAFPPNRPREDKPPSGDETPLSLLSSIVSTDRFICDYCMGTSLAGNGDDPACQGLCWHDVHRDASSLVNMLLPAHSLPEQSPQQNISEVDKQYPQQWSNEGPIDMPISWRKEWDKVVQNLGTHLRRIQAKRCERGGLVINSSSPTSSVLAYLYACAGHDAGKFLRGQLHILLLIIFLLHVIEFFLHLSALHRKSISWGTFQDAMCRMELDEWHCNAHSNNFVLLPPSSSQPSNGENHRPILAFLDLDLAYSAETFIGLNTTDHVTAGISKEAFTSIAWKEYVNLMEVLAGSDATSGVPQIALSTIQKQNPVFEGVKSALSDTLVLAYIDAYNENKHTFSGEIYDEDLHEAAYCIMKLAIIVMSPFVA